MPYGRYKKYYPWLYRTKSPILWWIKKWAYVRFILRELTSMGVAFYAVTLLLYVNSIAEGPEAFAAYTEWLQSPLSIGLHMVALALVVFHSVTWFNLAPKAMVIRVGKIKVPAAAVLAGNYALWATVTAGLYWLITTA